MPCFYLILALAIPFVTTALPAADRISFRETVAPILRDNCLACHGPKLAEGGYRVDNYTELLKPGDSGTTPVVAIKNPTTESAITATEESELLRRLLAADASERMPAESEPLAPEHIRQIRKWIETGASFDGPDPGAPLARVIPPAQYAEPPVSYRRPIAITALAFSPDGQQILAAGYHELLVWSMADSRLLRRISNLGQRIFAVAFSPDGRQIAVACGQPGRDGEVRLLDFATSEVTAVISRSDDVVLDIAYHPQHAELVTAAADGILRIFDLQTLEQTRAIASHADWVNSVAWSEDGKRMISGSRDKTAKVFDGQSGELLATYTGHAAGVRGVVFLADGQQAISTAGDGKLHRWNVEDTKRVAEIDLGGEGYKLVRDGDFVLVPCANGRLLQIGMSDNKIVRQFEGHSDWVLSTAFHPGSSRVASGAFDGEIRIWNATDASLTGAWISQP